MATFELQKVFTPRGFLGWFSRDARDQVWEYAPTFATEFALMACQMFAFKLAAHLFGKQGFSEYALVRRVISTVYPICLLGLSVALPRYIAMASKSGDPGLDKRFYGATLWCVGF